MSFRSRAYAVRPRRLASVSAAVVLAAFAAGCGSATHQTIIGNRTPVPLGAYDVTRTGPHELLVRAVAPVGDRGFAVALSSEGPGTRAYVYVLHGPAAARRSKRDGELVCLRVRAPDGVPAGKVTPVPRQPDPLAGLSRADLRALRAQGHGDALRCRRHDARLLTAVPRGA